MKWVLFVLFILLVSSSVCANDITLLAMAKGEDGVRGTVARLSLEIKPGSERVFLETFPLTQVSTQASLRFAQQIACSTLDFDCSGYDFFYTIHALPGIVGGPSAGSSAALLTASVLLNRSLPDDVATTGTINSGGVIGPVGGLEHKLEAASEHGITSVFIPKGSRNLTFNDSAVSVDYFSKVYNISIVEAAEFGELLEHSLGVPFVVEHRDIEIDDRYADIMGDVAVQLCDRSSSFSVDSDIGSNYTSLAEDALKNGSFYSAASFCFRANVEFRRESLRSGNVSIPLLVEGLSARISGSSIELLNRSIGSITDLQTYMAVMERLEESEGILEEDNLSSDDFAFAEERFHSALAWARFFDGGGERMRFDEESLKDSCVSKLSEAEERLNYISSVLDGSLTRTKEDISKARSYLFNENYIMCLFTAAKAKSESNVVMNLLGVAESDFEDVIDLKIRIANNAVARSLDKGVFPIIAYSYLEYSKSLRDLDRISSLLFAEYALELSNLDIYFDKEESVVEDRVSFTQYVIAGLGLVLIVFSLFLRRNL